MVSANDDGDIGDGVCGADIFHLQMKVIKGRAGATLSSHWERGSKRLGTIVLNIYLTN